MLGLEYFLTGLYLCLLEVKNTLNQSSKVCTWKQAFRPLPYYTPLNNNYCLGHGDQSSINWHSGVHLRSPSDMDVDQGHIIICCNNSALFHYWWVTSQSLYHILYFNDFWGFHKPGYICCQCHGIIMLLQHNASPNQKYTLSWEVHQQICLVCIIHYHWLC